MIGQTMSINGTDKNNVTHCPLCDFKGIADGTCMRCGLVFDQSLKTHLRKTSATQMKPDSQLKTKVKKKKNIIKFVSTITRPSNRGQD